MSETTNASGTLTRTRKQSDALYPHYFSSFQNYCCGPKARGIVSPTSKDHLPIPEQFKIRASELLNFINGHLIERIYQITQTTSVLPYQFFEQDREIDGQRYLVDRTMFKTMSDAGVINWVPSLKKLYPVRTSGNGNCLLHAVLIAMAGVHDFDLYLRDRLRQFMTNNNEVLKKSWKIERLKTDKLYGIQSEESKLDSEWEELCDLVRYENSEDGQTASNLQFLEAVHIFSISNMLARPIIILSEEVVRNKHGEAISYNDLFGIYLPILAKRQDCVPIPIVLAYDQSHFCPLQTSNLDTGTTVDNYLPLYQSVEHVRNQTLLPIRFLGSETGVEDPNGLLNSYLRMKKLTYYPDTKAPGISIQCVELGTKHLYDDNNFYLLYYKYITNFFETQKKKLQEEEEEKRRWEQEYYPDNQLTSETTQRTLIRPEVSSSPPPYSSISARSNENKKPLIVERRPSYGEAVANGALSVLSSNNNRSMNQYSEPQKSQLTYPVSYNIDNYQNNNKNHPPGISEWDVANDEPISNGKITNYSSPSTRPNDSKFKQEQQQKPQIPARMPVRLGKNDSPANLIDFDQRTDRIRPCIICKRLIEDLSSTGLCSECGYERKPLVTRQIVVKHSPPINPSPSTNLVDFDRKTDNIRPCIICKRNFEDLASTKLCPQCDQPRNPSVVRYVTVRRSPPSNNYSPAYPNSDFLTPHSSSSKIRGPSKIICPSCRQLNMLQNVQPGHSYNCSTCQRILQVPRY